MYVNDSFLFGEFLPAFVFQLKQLEQMEIKSGKTMNEISGKWQSTKDKDVNQNEIDGLNKRLIQVQAKFHFIGSCAEDLLKRKDAVMKNWIYQTDSRFRSKTNFYWTSSRSNRSSCVLHIEQKHLDIEENNEQNKEI